MHILIAGSRSWTDYNKLVVTLDDFIATADASEIVVVSGGAKGADNLAEKYAKERGYELLVMPADWERYGKSAGYRRNEEMHKTIAKDTDRACICFWDGKSKGTAHNFELSKKYNTPLLVVKGE